MKNEQEILKLVILLGVIAGDTSRPINTRLGAAHGAACCALILQDDKMLKVAQLCVTALEEEAFGTTQETSHVE